MLLTRCYFTKEFDRFIPQLKDYPHTIVHFEKRHQLKKENSFFRYNYLILEGFCKVSVIHDSGEEKIIGYWGTGSMYPIITSEQQFMLEDSIVVSAVTPVCAMRFDCSITKQIMKEIPDISYEMIDHYCKFTNLLFFCAASQTYEDVLTRVCNILYIYSRNSETNNISISQSELASIIGAKRESVVKILKVLREARIVGTQRNQIQIYNIEKLETMTSLLLQ